MVRAFRESLWTGREPKLFGLEGLRDLAVVVTAYEAIAQGIALPHSPP